MYFTNRWARRKNTLNPKTITKVRNQAICKSTELYALGIAHLYNVNGTEVINRKIIQLLWWPSPSPKQAVTDCRSRLSLPPPGSTSDSAEKPGGRAGAALLGQPLCSYCLNNFFLTWHLYWKLASRPPPPGLPANSFLGACMRAGAVTFSVF